MIGEPDARAPAKPGGPKAKGFQAIPKGNHLHPGGLGGQVAPPQPPCKRSKAAPNRPTACSSAAAQLKVCSVVAPKKSNSHQSALHTELQLM